MREREGQRDTLHALTMSLGPEGHLPVKEEESYPPLAPMAVHK